MHGTHTSTRQEYAIKVLDKGHLKRNNKLHTALAEKNTLVRLGSGHPGIVRLHWSFQDEWSLCESATSIVISSVKGKDCHYRWVDTMAKGRAVPALHAWRVIVDFATMQPSWASPQAATFPYPCPRSPYGMRSDCQDFLRISIYAAARWRNPSPFSRHS